MYCLQMFVHVLHKVLQAGTHKTDLLRVGTEMMHSRYFNYIPAKWLTYPWTLFSRGITIFQHMKISTSRRSKIKGWLFVFKKDLLCDSLNETNNHNNIRFHLKFFWALLLKNKQTNKKGVTDYHIDSSRHTTLGPWDGLSKEFSRSPPFNSSAALQPGRYLGLVPTLHLTVETAGSQQKWQTCWHKFLRCLDRATWWFIYRGSFALIATLGQFD